MDFIRNFLQFPSVSVSIPKKLPKFKKLRQWSHDSLANLSQLTNRAVGTLNERTHQSNQEIHHPIPTSGISTISAAINQQQMDPKKDNCGLYALKCDRSRTLANAKRGILLNLPSTSTVSSIPKLKNSGSFQTVDRNHEVFKSCEAVDDENLSKNPKALKIVPPPRKKKKPNLPLPHHKATLQHKINKAGQGTISAFETVERNDSGLYKIVNASETAKITYVEPRVTVKEMKSVTALAKPKIEKAVIVKSTSLDAKREIYPKVRDYEWSKQQRRPSQGILSKKAPSMKKSSSVDPSSGSVDIFKSNRLIDQKKLFDEFDELFEKNNKNIERKKHEEEQEEEDLALKSPSFAFRRLNELKKFPSSSFSISTDESDDKKEMKLISAMTTAAIPDFNLKSTQSGDYLTATSKPKIISEQKKILYYNDENELQDLIMKRMSSRKLSVASEIVETNEDATSSFDYKSKHPPSISTSLSSSQQVIAAHSNSTKSNSLKIFSNEGIFVFNL